MRRLERDDRQAGDAKRVRDVEHARVGNARVEDGRPAAEIEDALREDGRRLHEIPHRRRRREHEDNGAQMETAGECRPFSASASGLATAAAAPLAALVVFLLLVVAAASAAL